MLMLMWEWKYTYINIKHNSILGLFEVRHQKEKNACSLVWSLRFKTSQNIFHALMTVDFLAELQNGVEFVLQGLSKLHEDGDIGQKSKVGTYTWR